MTPSPTAGADELGARRRHPTAHPWRTDGERMAQAIAARRRDDGDREAATTPLLTTVSR